MLEYSVSFIFCLNSPFAEYLLISYLLLPSFIIIFGGPIIALAILPTHWRGLFWLGFLLSFIFGSFCLLFLSNWLGFDFGLPVDFDVGLPVGFDVGLPVVFDVGLPVGFDVGLPVGFDIGLQ